MHGEGEREVNFASETRAGVPLLIDTKIIFAFASKRDE